MKPHPAVLELFRSGGPSELSSGAHKVANAPEKAFRDGLFANGAVESRKLPSSLPPYIPMPEFRIFTLKMKSLQMSLKAKINLLIMLETCPKPPAGHGSVRYFCRILTEVGKRRQIFVKLLNIRK
jgi:hypothetical protein